MCICRDVDSHRPDFCKRNVLPDLHMLSLIKDCRKACIIRGVVWHAERVLHGVDLAQTNLL